MLEVVLRVRPPTSWLTDIVSMLGKAVFVHECTAFGDCGAQGLIEMDAKADDANGIIQGLLSHPDVVGLNISHTEGEKIIVSVTTKKWVACTTILQSDCYIRSAKAFPGGAIEWRLLTPGVKTLEDIISKLKEEGCEVDLLKKRRAESVDRLTNRQVLVMQKALEFGYFDHPRRIIARDLAKKVGIAPSTLSETLKRAEKKMAEFYLRKGQI